MNRICIAVPTYRRLDYLPALFAALRSLGRPAGYLVSAVFADNDPEQSARSLVLEAAAKMPFELRYIHVAQPGLASVRNALLTHARDHGDAIAMLDDDELPEPHWLEELVRVSAETQADAVVGPVTAMLPSDAPAWLSDFREREYPRFTDRQRLRDGWSSNALVRLARVEALGLSFDAALNFSGGEDQLFFRQLIAAGGSIAYAARATVWEHLPGDRRSLGFIMRRSFRRGSSLAVCDRRLHGVARGVLLRAAKACAIIAAAAIRIVPTALLQRERATVSHTSEIARGAGMLAGLAGASYQPYRRKA